MGLYMLRNTYAWLSLLLCCWVLSKGAARTSSRLNTSVPVNSRANPTLATQGSRYTQLHVMRASTTRCSGRPIPNSACITSCKPVRWTEC